MDLERNRLFGRPYSTRVDRCAALALDPLPLEDQGEYDLNEIHEPFELTDPYGEMWLRFASKPRRAFEFSGIAWGEVLASNQTTTKHVLSRMRLK